MSWGKPDSKWLLNELINLVTNTSLSKDERELFLSGKRALEDNRDDRQVANALKTKLSLLAVQQKLSPISVDFLKELANHYVGPTGIGGRDVLFQL